MSNNKQTAVEWLVDKLTVQNDEGEVVNAYPDWIDLTEIIEEAKQMEKQQIIRSHMNVSDDRDYRLQDVHLKEFAEEYYEKNYAK